MNSIPSTPIQRPSWFRWLLLGGVAFGLVGIVCCGFAAFGSVKLLQNLRTESDAIQPTLRAFLDAGQRGDAAAAQKLFATQADTSVSTADLDRLFTEHPALFAGYTDITIDTINLTRATDGTDATIAGSIIYTQGTQSRSYTATLWKEGDAWKLTQIQFPDGVGQ